MSPEQEKQLITNARKVLNPEKYNAFMNDYIKQIKSIERKDFAIYNNLQQNSDKDFSSYQLAMCTAQEQSNFWNITDSTVKLTVISGIHQKSGRIRTLSDIVKEMEKPEFRLLNKMSRPLMFATSNGHRPIGESSIISWNGFQVIDLDIKNYELANKLKYQIFDGLCKENWFCGVTLSASGQGLHVWTKIHVPEGLEQEQLKTLYALNFRHKYSAVYIVIEKQAPELTSNDIISFMDLSMFRPQQGVFIPGSTPIINSNFKDLPILFESIMNKERLYADQQWVTAKPLLETFSKWEWFSNYKKEDNDNINYEKLVATGSYQLNGVKIHYKHAQRWQLANTLCSIYGFEESMKLLRAIVDDKVPTSELRGDLLTANNHNKPISKWAIQQLNTFHGFNIKYEGQNTAKPIANGEIYDIWQDTKCEHVEFKIKSSQYLSDITEELKQSFGHINILEAGAGYGKTEMIKRLGGKIILVLPFTSIIESKFNDAEDWECFFQNRTVEKADLEKYNKLCMTVDKFARLTMMDVNFSYFDYIVLDESHLLFLSEYRPIMAQAVDNLAHSTSKVIMMTGTTSGESLFFPNAKHIIVKREETRNKTFTTIWGNKPKDTRILMTQAMAIAIMEGRKVLYPTNAGTARYETLIADINEFLFYQHFERPVRAEYYKKANEGSFSMNKITFEKTIDNLDIVACTSYLSVGVDICDKYDFEIFFDSLLIAQDIEQYANRIRENNLHIKMYLPRFTEDGDEIDYKTVIPFNMEINNRELETARDTVKMCNALIVKARGEYRYNPIIQNVLSADRYIRFSDTLGLYYIDETAYKLHIFEKQYRHYAAQLPVIKQAIEHYGYEYFDNDDKAFSLSSDTENAIEQLNKETRKAKYERDTVETFKFIQCLNDNNIDILLETLQGRFYIRKDETLSTAFTVNDNTLYLRNPELFAKNMPLIKSFYRFYDFETISCIFDFCMNDISKKINYSLLKRIAKLVSIEFNKRKGRVDISILKFMQTIRTWVDERDTRTSAEIQDFLKQITVQYIANTGEFLLSNIDLVAHTYEMIKDLFKIFVNKSNKKDKDGKYKLSLYKLLWTEKTDITQLYGNTNTKIFFLGDMLDSHMQKQDSIIDITDDIIIPEEEPVEIKNENLDPSVIMPITFNYGIYAKTNSIINDYYAAQLENYNWDSLKSNKEEDKEKPGVQTSENTHQNLFSNLSN